MAPLLNSRTVAVMCALWEMFQSRLSHVPPVGRHILAYLCSMFATISFCCGVIALTMLLLSSNLKPQFPLVQLLDSVTITSLNTCAVNLTASINVSFVFKNPNRKLAVSYKNLEAKLWFGNDNHTLASTSLPPVSQGAESAIRIGAQLILVDGFANSRGVAKGIGGGSVNFGVSLLGWVRFGHGVLQSRVVPLRVECNHVLIVFPPGNKNGTWSGTLVGPSYCGAV